MHVQHIGPCILELVIGDLTQQPTDAIVNAANSRLAGGGGVDGAIHRGGGPSIMAETRRQYPEGCPTGEAVITAAGNLPAQYVIHTVGPIWSGGQHREEAQLMSAYRRSLAVAVAHDCHSLAFPSISTGVYGYPIEQAARAALRTVLTFLEQHGQPGLVRFVLFDTGTYNAYKAALESSG